MGGHEVGGVAQAMMHDGTWMHAAGLTALHEACRNGHLECVALLIQVCSLTHCAQATQASDPES